MLVVVSSSDSYFSSWLPSTSMFNNHTAPIRKLRGGNFSVCQDASYFLLRGQICQPNRCWFHTGGTLFLPDRKHSVINLTGRLQFCEPSFPFDVLSHFSFLLLQTSPGTESHCLFLICSHDRRVLFHYCSTVKYLQGQFVSSTSVGSAFNWLRMWLCTQRHGEGRGTTAHSDPKPSSPPMTQDRSALSPTGRHTG